MSEASNTSPRHRSFYLRRLTILFTLWVPFGAWTLLALQRVSGVPWTIVALSPFLSITGPMVGAISRGFQPCCLQASLAILPYCLAAMAIAVGLQAVPVSSRAFTSAVLWAWTAGLAIWFAGGLLSMIHAVS